MSFLNQGKRWKCIFCNTINDVEEGYYSPLNQDGLRNDLQQRYELTHCSIEIAAPLEYTVRQPMAPCYVFVIDVSLNAQKCGMVQSICNGILDSLDKLPGGKRTQIGFITFDSKIHFYTLKEGAMAPQMLVLSDLNDIFIPAEQDLVVNLDQNRELIEQLLESLPYMHNNTTDVETATGPALDAATRIMSQNGGKLMLFLSSLPSLGFGRLKHREDAKLLGTNKEHTILAAGDKFYKTSAQKLTRFQISCNIYLFSEAYIDVSTLSNLTENTGGSIYYYNKYQANLNENKFIHDLKHDLTRVTGWEGVTRTRVTKGVNCTNFYGSFF